MHKKLITLTSIVALTASTISYAGKDIDDDHIPHKSITVRPYTYTNTQDIASLHISDQGDFFAEDHLGQTMVINKANIPSTLINDLKDHGISGISRLLQHNHIYIKANDHGELSLFLLRPLKGGGGPNGTFCGNNVCVGGGYDKGGGLSFTISPMSSTGSNIPHGNPDKDSYSYDYNISDHYGGSIYNTDIYTQEGQKYVGLWGVHNTDAPMPKGVKTDKNKNGIIGVLHPKTKLVYPRFWPFQPETHSFIPKGHTIGPLEADLNKIDFNACIPTFQNMGSKFNISKYVGGNDRTWYTKYLQATPFLVAHEFDTMLSSAMQDKHHLSKISLAQLKANIHEMVTLHMQNTAFWGEFAGSSIPTRSAIIRVVSDTAYDHAISYLISNGSANIHGALSIRGQHNNLLYPLFAEDRIKPDCFLPKGYTPLETFVKNHYSPTNEKEFVEKALLPKLQLLSSHPAYKSYDALVSTPGANYTKGMSIKDYVAKWDQKIIEQHLLPQLQKLSSSDAYKDYQSFIEHPGTGYKKGMDLQEYWDKWVNSKYGPTIASKKMDKTFDPLGLKDVDNLSYTSSFNQHEKLGEALLRGFGKGVDKLLCATIGACDANASPARLAMEVVKHGPTIINMADKGWKAVGSTIGLSAITQYNNKANNLITDIVDWLEAKPKIESYPLNENEKYDLLVTEGIIGEPKINITPVGNKLDIKLTTPILEDGVAKDRLIHMQITKDDMDFVDKAGLKGPVPADKDGGLKWSDGSKGNRAIRIMNGRPDADHESQREDYVKVVRDGQMRDVNGSPVLAGENGVAEAKKNPRTHINKKEWIKWKHPLHPTDPTGGIKK